MVNGDYPYTQRVDIVLYRLEKHRKSFYRQAGSVCDMFGPFSIANRIHMGTISKGGMVAERPRGELSHVTPEW